MSRFSPKCLFFILLLLPAFAQGSWVEGELLVKFKSKGKQKKQLHSQTLSKILPSQKFQIQQSWSKLGIYNLKFNKADLEQVRSRLQKSEDIEFIEKNYYLEPQDIEEEKVNLSLDDLQEIQGEFRISLDTLSQQQREQVDYQSKTFVNLFPFLNSQQNLPSVKKVPVVALVDSGLEWKRLIFNHVLWTNSKEIPGNNIDDDGNGYVDDVHGWNFGGDNNDISDTNGHGTHISGIILSLFTNIFQTQTKEDIPFRLMTLKYTSEDGQQTVASAINAIRYAVDHGADVINASWGTRDYSAMLYSAIEYAKNNDVVFVSAAGNYNTNNDKTPYYPANFDLENVISVASSTKDEELSSFSNYGKENVSVATLGDRVLSLEPFSNSLSGYSFRSGTSMAVGYAVGASLLLKMFYKITPKEIHYLLTNVETNLSLKDKVRSGGVLNLSSISKAIESAPTLDKTQLQTFVRTLASASLSDPQETNGNFHGGCGLVKNIYPGDSNPWKSFSWLFLILLPLLLVSFQTLSKNNKRIYERFFADYNIQVFKQGKEFRESLVNFSQGGLCLETSQQFEQGEKISVNIPLASKNISLSGRVAWKKGKRVGVEFVESQLYKKDLKLMKKDMS